ncbi:hypothetical protein [Jeotgalibacillus salarius]|uniref:Uncharacterized protein n=1 Tax=Jeotgalibacillus salarius TaxID=546023 RepID=A0A4Y8LGD1_9BACL|nr:hypothetical protein [Jeotgalibacillus salarius]TFE01716.1 hypothetical protein E2626_09105 [Jeotgalibacillus salarius]
MAEFLIIYYIGSIILTGFLIFKSKKNRLLKVAAVFFLPLIGWFVLYALLKSTDESKKYSFEDNEATEDNLSSTFMTVNVKEEVNVIPIQDALLLNDNHTKRKMLIHSLKENTMSNMQVLQKALENEDSETSHYAASAIVEMKRKRLNHIREIEEALSRRTDSALLAEHANAIQLYMDSGFLDDTAEQKYREKLTHTLSLLIESNEALPEHYKMKVEAELSLRRFREAQNASGLFLKQYPLEETAYLTSLKVYYASNDYFGIKQTLKEIRKNRVFLTTEGANAIRFWN